MINKLCEVCRIALDHILLTLRMNNDQSWMNHQGIDDRRKPSYIVGIDEFLEFAFNAREDAVKLRCPCLSCNFQLILMKLQ